MSIQWFPGHMAKAKREIQEKLKLVDFVIELLDARAPLSSQNPMLREVFNQKPKMIVLMKKDLADPEETAAWVTYFQAKDIPTIAVDGNNKADMNKVVQQAKQLGERKMAQLRRKGIQPRPARAMIVGIPNVGKSTLINRLAKRKIAKIGDRPGITKQQSWIKVKKDFELLDTPGILWPKFEDESIGYRLAAIGSIRDEVLSLQDITVFVIEYLQSNYPHVLYDKYDVPADIDDMEQVFRMIGERRGALGAGGVVDYEKVADLVLRDLRTGKLGNISLETVE